MCISVSVYVYFLQGGVGLGQESWVLRIVYLSCRAQGTLTLNPKSLGSDKHCSIINVATHCVHKSTALTWHTCSDASRVRSRLASRSLFKSSIALAKSDSNPAAWRPCSSSCLSNLLKITKYEVLQFLMKSPTVKLVIITGSSYQTLHELTAKVQPTKQNMCLMRYAVQTTNTGSLLE